MPLQDARFQLSLRVLALLVLVLCPVGFAFGEAAPRMAKSSEVAEKRHGPSSTRNNRITNRNNSNAEAVDPALVEDLLAPSAPPSQFPLSFSRPYGVMKPDSTAIRSRIEAMLNQPEVADPVVLKLATNNTVSLVRQLGRAEILSSDGDMPESATSPIRIARQLNSRVKEGKITLIPDDLTWLDLDKLSTLLGSRTVLPELDKGLWASALANDELRSQLDFYFQGQLPRISKAIERWTQSHPAQDAIPFDVLLPQTVKPLYGKYSHLRGRNCFGTALEFSTPRSQLNKSINVEQEEGHFRTMINSDEFLRALWLGYYELKPEEIMLGLKWGDVVVFYEDNPPFSWMSLRHAAVHVAGDVYFHKQSKSAASPIEFTDWQSIMNIWMRLTPNLGYLVFRRLPAGSSFQKPNRAIEKLSWTR